MIYLTSDPHGDKNARGLNQYLEQATDSDLLILLGDLELNFRDTDENREFSEWFLSLDKPIAFLDGNHENHPYLNTFPEEQWCGGTVHRLTQNIIHLKRGQIYTVNGKTLFTMGGCKSSARWKEWGLLYEGEVPSEEEITFAYENLKRHGNRVDYILSHKYKNAPEEIVLPLSLEELTRFIDKDVSFTHWYCGHWHRDLLFDDRHTYIYDQLTPFF